MITLPSATMPTATLILTTTFTLTVTLNTTPTAALNATLTATLPPSLLTTLTATPAATPTATPLLATLTVTHPHCHPATLTANHPHCHPHPPVPPGGRPKGPRPTASSAKRDDEFLALEERVRDLEREVEGAQEALAQAMERAKKASRA